MNRGVRRTAPHEVPLGTPPEDDRTNLTAWQAGALITPPWTAVDAADPPGPTEAGGAMPTMRQRPLRRLLGMIGSVLRHPAHYVARFGFGAFQVLFLPVLVIVTALTTLHTGWLR